MKVSQKKIILCAIFRLFIEENTHTQTHLVNSSIMCSLLYLLRILLYYRFTFLFFIYFLLGKELFVFYDWLHDLWSHSGKTITVTAFRCSHVSGWTDRLQEHRTRDVCPQCFWFSSSEMRVSNLYSTSEKVIATTLQMVSLLLFYDTVWGRHWIFIALLFVKSILDTVTLVA